jgi:hypothetical protein
MDRAKLARALAFICDAIVDAVSVAGSEGVPAGVVYAALSTEAFTLQRFERIISALVEAGRLRRSGDLLVAIDAGGENAH